MPAIERLAKKVQEAAKVLSHLRMSVERKKNKFKPGALKSAKVKELGSWRPKSACVGKALATRTRSRSVELTRNSSNSIDT